MPRLCPQPHPEYCVSALCTLWPLGHVQPSRKYGELMPRSDPSSVKDGTSWTPPAASSPPPHRGTIMGALTASQRVLSNAEPQFPMREPFSLMRECKPLIKATLGFPPRSQNHPHSPPRITSQIKQNLVSGSALGGAPGENTIL